MDSDIINVVSAIVTTVVTTIGVIFMAWQLREMRIATQSQAYVFAVQWLQDKGIHEARRTVFENLVEKPLENWSREEIVAAEWVCHTFDAVGIMGRYRMLSKKAVIETWGNSARRSWPIILPLMDKYRRERNDDWPGYKWLVDEADKGLS